jgi:exodeoxyribonuclease VII large subunit
MAADWPFDPETGELAEPQKPNIGEYSVSEISHALKRTLEDAFGHVRVRGEISGYRGPHSSGHAYFGLKDAGAKIDAVVWRGSFSRLRSKIQEGLEVIATGKISSFPGTSKYQIIIESIEPAGVGALMALLEERKRKLAAEGLFDEARKKPIPFLPRVIGVVTSPTGAVIRDILHRLNDRFPRHVIVWPVRVQGEGSAAEVAAAIRGFNAMAQKPDLIIVARGGGSLEDLWGFNEEIVVRAAAESAIPLISAVGHETDTTLIDFAADLRAPTPTAAAERAVPVRSELLAQTASLAARLERGKSRAMDERRTRLVAAARALPKPDELLALARQRHDAVSSRLGRALTANTRLHQTRLVKVAARLTGRPMLMNMKRSAADLAALAARAGRAIARGQDFRRQRYGAAAKLLESLSYNSVLQRGFAVVRDANDRPVPAAAQTAAGQGLDIQFRDGRVAVHVDGVKPKPQKPAGAGQGTLF